MVADSEPVRGMTATSPASRRWAICQASPYLLFLTFIPVLVWPSYDVAEQLFGGRHANLSSTRRRSPSAACSTGSAVLAWLRCTRTDPPNVYSPPRSTGPDVTDETKRSPVPDLPERAGHVSPEHLRHEAITMALYVATCLLAALAALTN